MTISMMINAVIAVWTAYTIYWYFRILNKDRPLKRNLQIFRFFTILSNCFSAMVSLAVLFLVLAGNSPAALPEGMMLLRMMATVSVTITFLTVVFFLVPTMGTWLLYKEDNLYMHVIGPWLAVIEFLFVEKGMLFAKGQIVIGVLPMLAYACLYLYRVVYQTEEKGGWPDFYGFNRNGMWRISVTAMVLASLLISAVLVLVHNMLL